MTATHEHAWQPILGWSGRYRCEGDGGCYCIGYRGVVVPGAQGLDGDTGYLPGDRKNVAGQKVSDIIPYRCATKGCNGWAIGRKPRNYCWACRPKKEGGPIVRALWVGGPPGSTIKSIVANLAGVGVDVVEQWDKDDAVIRKTRIPNSIDVVLFNKDMCGHNEETHTKDLSKRQGVPFVTASTKATRTIRNMRALGLIAESAPELEEESMAEESMVLRPIKRRTRKLIERAETYALADLLTAAGFSGIDAVELHDGESAVRVKPEAATLTLEWSEEEIDG